MQRRKVHISCTATVKGVNLLRKACRIDSNFLLVLTTLCVIRVNKIGSFVLLARS